MEYLVLAGIVAGIGMWAYRSGKRQGSRGGYAAGRRRARRDRRP